MKLLNKKLYSLDYVIRYISSTVGKPDGYEIRFISDAPLLIRFLSRGGYCTYNKTIYVPSMHLQLMGSKHDEDKNLATAKLIPSIMLLHDNDSISFSVFLKMLFLPRYQIHYFIYEFLFLKYTEHEFTKLILDGFLTSRHTWYGKDIPFDTVEETIRAILTTKSKN